MKSKPKKKKKKIWYLISEGANSYITTAPTDHYDFHGDEFSSFREAKKALLEFFKERSLDYCYAHKETRKLKKKDVI